MDARVKIVLIIAFIVLVFVGQNYPALGIVVVSVLGVMAFSNVPVKLYFKSLRMIIFVVILTAGLNLFYGRGEPLWQFGFMTITEAGITNAVFIALRIISLIFISSVLTFTTSPTDLTDALERLMKTRTTIAIAHRLSTIKNADEICVLYEGEIVERGRHEALLEKDGYYKRLNDMQSLA